MSRLTRWAIGFTLVVACLTALASCTPARYDCSRTLSREAAPYSGYTPCDMACASACITDSCLARCGCDY